MTKGKSSRGTRNAKLTVLVPQGVIEDLRALRTATFQSTGDLINQLIEAELSRQQEAIKEGYEFLKIQETREARAKERRGIAKESKAKPSDVAEAIRIKEEPREEPREGIDGEPWPTASDIDTWSALASSISEIRKRKVHASAFIEWAGKNHEPITEESAYRFYETVLLPNFKEHTAKNRRVHNISFAKWWAEKQGL